MHMHVSKVLQSHAMGSKDTHSFISVLLQMLCLYPVVSCETRY